VVGQLAHEIVVANQGLDWPVDGKGTMWRVSYDRLAPCIPRTVGTALAIAGVAAALLASGIVTSLITLILRHDDLHTYQNKNANHLDGQVTVLSQVFTGYVDYPMYYVPIRCQYFGGARVG
jgi:hypothetical protein